MTELAWGGYFNARDLGGLPTALSPHGATVPGRIARGPRRERLSAGGWADARAWGLSSVVDLRCPYEIGRRDEDPVVGPETLDGLSIVNAPTEDQSDPAFREACFPILDSPEYWSHNWRLQPHLVRAALEAIASAEPGVLVHCSAGRDRTGMVSALLLGNAGVDPAAVALDYAASVRAMAGATHQSPTADAQSRWSPGETEDWLAGKVGIVRDVATGARDILEMLGVPAAVGEALRAMLIDPTPGVAGSRTRSSSSANTYGRIGP
ncbi:tyrosine-protein phosphatase [Paeniglutamicibacter sp. R2-26]|uniref:tyrosine-protein phosphatase n=1 Tax=Paeniglutamicibacter sp. R2-26 TaxID=3144417 RepID=UPI003EE61B68